jgi:hypothetical protein
LIKNRKYFLTPQKDGFPKGPRTADLLAEAITRIDANGSGVDLRTVQLWFQDNEKGISTDNIRWLARFFGCDDPQATSEWQAGLSAAQSCLTAKRRERKKNGDNDQPSPQEMEASATVGRNTIGPIQRFNLTRTSEALFSYRSPFDYRS